ncbi:MAG: hypothetical protein R3199_07845 [Gemmatimonadota bacterium]|nr:hypothetical protein [Gemmatimonadota bacterium]
MPIIDQELFVACPVCGSEVATGIRRTEEELREDPPGERRFTCSRCGETRSHDGEDYYHRTVEHDRDIVDV